MRLRTGDFEIDVPSRRLTGPDGPIHVQPQVFDLLVFLIEQRDRVVSKVEALESVWGDQFVSESALTTRIKQARQALGDNGQAQAFIRNVHGRGYQFVAPVSVVGEGAPSVGPSADSTEATGRESLSADIAENTRLSGLADYANPMRGRSEEFDQLERLLAEHRLVTVLGPGGTGKTRLCVEFARSRLARTRVRFVDLAAVREAASIGETLAVALGIETGMHDDIVEAACSHLRSRPTLLVVDNCEHVPTASAELVNRLLAEAPETRVLATSRVPLKARLEQVMMLRPLPSLVASDGIDVAAALGNSAVALFADRARQASAGYELTAASVGDVVGLCNALDGLPLALELAAGRMATFSPADLLSRLDRRLDLLGDDRVDADDRHRSLRATLDWSYELLDHECRNFFCHLAAFPGGHALDGVEWLAEQIGLADPLSLLNRLVEASLVARSERQSGVRYTQLETMRAFGLDKLAETKSLDDARDLVAEWGLFVTGRMSEELRSERTYYWNLRIRDELANLRAARSQLQATGRHEGLLAITINCDEWAKLRNVSEMWNWADELALYEFDDPVMAARSLAVRSVPAWRRGRIDEGSALAAAALDELERSGVVDDVARAKALSGAGVTSLFAGDLERAEAVWTERMAVDGYVIDGANAALCAAYSGDIERADTMMAAITGSYSGEWPQARAWLSYILGEIDLMAGRASATERLTEALNGAEETGSMFILGIAGVSLASAMAAAGDVREAAARYADLIDHWLRAGVWTQLWTTMRNAAPLLVDTDPALGVRVLDAADADPFAASVEASAREVLDAKRTELVAAAEAAATERSFETGSGAAVEREKLATSTRAALLAAADG